MKTHDQRGEDNTEGEKGITEKGRLSTQSFVVLGHLCVGLVNKRCEAGDRFVQRKPQKTFNENHLHMKSSNR